jgi:glycosyltransferase involved in cell wall biosynthesis
MTRIDLHTSADLTLSPLATGSPALPFLLYVGDVPVEASYHGSALLYRLLQRYPAERLCILEASLQVSQPARRLAGVRYEILPIGQQRWLNTRFHSLVSSWLTLRAVGLTRRISSVLGAFSPEAVVTVAHGFSWLTAAAFARQNHLPLHLIVHDDWPRAVRLPVHIKRWLERRFGEVYRQAASRFCISPFMVEEYEQRYGVRGTLLYPSRAADAPEIAAPPERLGETGRPLVFAFGGNINSGGHLHALRQLAESLLPLGARLHLYGPISQGEAERAGLLQTNVRLCGLVPAAEFIPRMRAEADVLFVPMSFAPEDRANMSLCFPSKLTDYTSAGLPILIYGPEYSSAVRWALENSGLAEVVSVEDEGQLVGAVERLSQVPDHRVRLAVRALEVGRHLFSHAAALSILNAALIPAQGHHDI